MLRGFVLNDICQNAYGMGLFTGGLGFHQGATRVGCAVIPISSGQTERQIIIMQDFGVTVLFYTPTNALTIAMRKEIEERMRIKAMEAYGLTECGGPGTAYDRIAQDGFHLNEHYRLVPPKSITRSEGKAKRVIDERKM